MDASSPVGWVIAAGAVALVNDALFAPIAENKAPFTGVNWRIIPATGILAAALYGLDKLAPGFGKGLAMLVLASVLLIPYGNAPTPLQSISTALGYAKKAG